MEVLKDFPKEFAKSLRTSLNFLCIINLRLWFGNEGWLTRNWRFFYIIPAIISHCVSLAIDVLNKLMMEGNTVEILHRLPQFLVLAQGVLKIAFILPKMTLITNVIKVLGHLWNISRHNVDRLKETRTILNRVNRTTKVMYWYVLFAGFTYLLTPLFDTLICKFVLRRDPALPPLLPLGGSYPFDPTGNWLVYIVVYAFQIYSTFLCVMGYVGSGMMLMTLCALLTIEFSKLYEDLLSVETVNKKKINGTRRGSRSGECTIEQLVQRHQKLLWCVSEMNNIFKEQLFINFLFIGITTCLFGYAAKFSQGSIYKLNNYGALIAPLLVVLCICYYGELLADASLRISEAAYNNLWYNGDRDYQTTILIIIRRSQKPCFLKSIMGTPLSLNTFAKVISTTWSYFSLMRSVYRDEE